MILLAGRTRPAPQTILGDVVPGLQVLEVLPLSHGESIVLFAALAVSGAIAPPQAVVERYTRLAEGNPYFLRELAAHWEVTGVTKSPPQSILAALDTRLSKLSPKSLRVLQVCALLGKNSTLDRLERVLDLRRLDLLDALEALDTQSVLQCDGESVYTKHDLLSEAALAKLSPTATQLLHGQIGQVLESDLTPRHYASLLWDSAEHLRAAGKVSAAARLMARCADHALQLGFANEAIAIWERARELSPLNAEQQQQIYSGLIVSLGQTAMWHKMLRVASDTAAPKASDRPIEHTHDDAELALFEAEWQTAWAARRIHCHGYCACARDIEAPTPIHRARASVVALTIAHNLPAAPVAKEAHEIVESLAGRGDELVGQQLAADLIYHTAFGSLQKGIDAGRSLMDLTKHGKSFTRFLWALRAAAMPLLYSGDFSGARRLLAEARGLAIECCLFDAAMSATEMIAKSYFQEGNCEAAKDWAAAYREISAPPEGRHRFSLFDPTQAQIDLLEDRLGSAAGTQTILIAPVGQTCRRSGLEAQRMRLSPFHVWPWGRSFTKARSSTLLSGARANQGGKTSPLTPCGHCARGQEKRIRRPSYYDITSNPSAESGRLCLSFCPRRFVK